MEDSEETPQTSLVIEASCTKHERLPWPGLDEATDFAPLSPRSEGDADDQLAARSFHSLREPLQKAIRSKGNAEVEALLRSGALVCDEYCLDAEIGGATGTAIDLMLLERRYKLALKVLQRGDGDEEPAKIAGSCVHAVAWAAKQGRAEILDLLLQQKADPAQRDEQGRSALLLAALRGRLPCARLLLDAGALELEHPQEQEEIEAWLKHWKFGEGGRDKSLTVENVAAIETLKQKSPRVDWPEWRLKCAAEDSRQGALARAITQKGVKDVLEQVRAGAPLLAEYMLDDRGRDLGTALDLAMRHRRFQLAETLLAGEEGAALAQASKRALAWAAKDGRDKLVTELLRLGANPGCCDERSRSALLLACMRGYKPCVQALLQAGAWATETEDSQAQVREWAAHFKLKLPAACSA